MYNEISIEQRTHDLAVAATILYYQQNNIEITESNAFDYAMKYRSLLKPLRDSIEEGKEDLVKFLVVQIFVHFSINSNR